MEDYEAFKKQARLYTSVHARTKNPELLKRIAHEHQIAQEEMKKDEPVS